MQTMQKITDLHKVPPRTHTHAHSAAHMQTRFSEKLMELRHRGLRTGSCTQRAREGKKEKRDEEHQHSYESHAGGKGRTPERQVEEEEGARAKAKLRRAMSEDRKKKETTTVRKGKVNRESYSHTEGKD